MNPIPPSDLLTLQITKKIAAPPQTMIRITAAHNALLLTIFVDVIFNDVKKRRIEIVLAFKYVEE